jgi:hypothetical protein
LCPTADGSGNVTLAQVYTPCGVPLLDAVHAGVIILSHGAVVGAGVEHEPGPLDLAQSERQSIPIQQR